METLLTLIQFSVTVYLVYLILNTVDRVKELEEEVLNLTIILFENSEVVDE